MDVWDLTYGSEVERRGAGGVLRERRGLIGSGGVVGRWWRNGGGEGDQWWRRVRRRWRW